MYDFTSMSLTEIIGQIIGILACIVQIASFQMKRNRDLYILQIISAILFTLNFLMIGSLAAGIINFVTLFRGLLMWWGEKGHKTYWFALLIVAYVAATALTFDSEGLLSIFAAVAQIIGTFAIWTDNGNFIRKAQLFAVSPLWLYHNICQGAIGAIICESFNIVSVIVSMIRFRKTGFEK